jgi:hypothetical protein
MPFFVALTILSSAFFTSSFSLKGISVCKSLLGPVYDFEPGVFLSVDFFDVGVITFPPLYITFGYLKGLQYFNV